MNWLSLPPLSSLRAFAAFAETGNLARAGGALNVSHAAISQQIRALEGHLGVALVDRSGRAMVLTAEGRQLSDALALGFGAIGAAVQDLAAQTADRPLHVSVTPSLAGYWLLPRLAGFSRLHPEISLRVDPSPELVDLKPGGIDLALRHGEGGWPGVESEPLLPAPLAIVAAPQLLQGQRVATPADLADLPWIEELGTTEASAWLAEQGARIGAGRSTQLPGNLTLESARAGQGLLLIVRLFVEADIAAGRLVELFATRQNSHYHIITRPGVQRPAARAFIAWLRREARGAGAAGRSGAEARDGGGQ
ncbi:LysR family transcriptional regulator [Pseudodonghicola xiamenensis]|uniref:Transcriptional regulator n=1 Tax=Pseudodonghicola xiamenensis TaxID=337702 RepID=A0A8J3H7W4_9RHOB|nr:LysR family transcriptional regulator [Pseudodonghicola xiamenensis]GHG89010.1 transcriptional regulator [Pseudodonghicola xiamenensis]